MFHSNSVIKGTLITMAFWIAGLSTATSFAGEKSATVVAGFSQSAVGFGANYENRISNQLGLGGYFLHSSEKNDANKNQVIAIGAFANGHIIDNNDFELYLAPGFGILMVKGQRGTLSNDDQTTFGPAWKMGFLFKATPNVKLGLEQTELVNWFSEKAPGHFSMTNFAVSFSL